MSVSDEDLLAIQKLAAAETPAEDPGDEPAEDVEPDDPEAEDPEAGDDADAEDTQGEEIERLKAQLAQREKDLVRGFNKRMQKLSAREKELVQAAKVSREVDFVARKMQDNEQFADEFRALASKHGVVMPDVTAEDIEEKIERAIGKVLERMDEKDDEDKAQSYSHLLLQEQKRLVTEYGIDAQTADRIFAEASDPDTGLLRAGMTPAQVSKALDKAARIVLYPTAATRGQKALLNRGKTKVRSAASLGTRGDTNNEPLRATSFHEDPEVVLQKIRAGG